MSERRVATRDAARIPVVLERIRRAWEAVPELRLGPLLHNATSDVGTSLYETEDAELAGLVERYVHHARVRPNRPASSGMLP
jgi:hypothetical protein